MSNGQQDDQRSGVPLPIIPMPLESGAVDQPSAPQQIVPDVPGVRHTAKTVKPFGTTPQKPDYDPNFPLLSKSKGFQAAMAKYKDEPGPEESTLPKSVIMQRQLNVMENSPIFKQANADLRLKLQMAFWKQYVEPLGRLDAHPVALKDWLQARGQKWLEEHPNPKITTSDISKLGLAGGHALIKEAAGATDIASTIATHSQWDNLKKDWSNLKGQIGAAGAMLNAQLAPHMGPILIGVPHEKLNEVHYNPNIPGMGMNMDELYKTSKYVQHNYYRNTAYDQLVLKGGGELLGTIPAFYTMGAAGEAASGLRAVDEATLMAQTPEEISAARKLYAGGKLFGRFGVVAGDVGKSSIHAAAEGYLLGSLEREGHPTRDAVNFALGNAFFGGGTKLLGKLRIWGDQKVTSEMLDKAVEDYMSKQPTSHTTQAAVAMAGTPQQKLTRALMEAINKETKGAFWNAPMEAKQATLKVLAAKYPELAKNAGWLDEHLTELQALHETAQWRELMPEADAALKKLEQIDGGEPTSKTVAKQVSEKERAEHLQSAPPGTVAKATESSTGGPGAAKASSLEFSDNFTKHVDTKLDALGLGKDRYTWESRGHKLLFYLNVIASETKAKGPSAELSQEAQLLLHQLTQEFPGKNLKELLGMSDTLWTKISNLEKGDFVKPGVPTRIWRQTHLEPGESPFAHEVDLLQKAAKAERAKRVEAAKAAKAAKGDKREAYAIQLRNLHDKLTKATGDERIRLVEEISNVQAKMAREAEKVAKAEQIEKAPTASKEFQTAAQQYVAALRKLGYTNDDISKMTPAQLVDIISKKTSKVPPAVTKVEAPKVETEAPKVAVKLIVTKADEAALKAAGFTQEKINSMKPAEVQEALSKVAADKEKLAAAFKKTADVGTGKIDTSIQREVMERMFPDVKDFRDLTPSEQSEVMMTARKLQLSREKGKK